MKSTKQIIYTLAFVLLLIGMLSGSVYALYSAVDTVTDKPTLSEQNETVIYNEPSVEEVVAATENDTVESEPHETVTQTSKEDLPDVLPENGHTSA